jgi:SagB-type dehydrogenase family enzyme
MFGACCIVGVLCFFAAIVLAEELKPISLPKPKTEGGKPLMEALRERQSMRAFQSRPLSMEHLSNLLWAAFGINRPDSGKRTAPSAMNSQEIDIYVVLADAVHIYEAKTHSLVPVLAQDVRAMTGGQEFVKEAPLNLVYVADYAKVNKRAKDSRQIYAAAHAGFIGQNVYLYCASEGLGSVFRAGMDRDALRKALKLRDDQEIMSVQTVGYPK